MEAADSKPAISRFNSCRGVHMITEKYNVTYCNYEDRKTITWSKNDYEHRSSRNGKELPSYYEFNCHKLSLVDYRINGKLFRANGASMIVLHDSIYEKFFYIGKKKFKSLEEQKMYLACR